MNGAGMNVGKTGAVLVDAGELESMRANASRYETILEHMQSMVLVTPKGSTITMRAENRGADFTRSGMDAALDGLASGARK